MAKKKRPTSAPLGAYGSAMPRERVTERVAHAASGAAGKHADSNARRNAPGTYRTNRVGSRSAQRRAAIADG